MMNKKELTFNEFCHKNCDGLYDPHFSLEEQCTGYTKLRQMVVENITPASLEEVERWEKKPTLKELMCEPDIKYLRFLHVLLRPKVIEYWDFIKKLKID